MFAFVVLLSVLLTRLYQALAFDVNTFGNFCEHGINKSLWSPPYDEHSAVRGVVWEFRGGRSRAHRSGNWQEASYPVKLPPNVAVLAVN